MPYPILTADELREVGEIIDIAHQYGNEFSDMVEMLINAHPKAIGYTVFYLRCDKCGHKRLTVAQIPCTFPQECYNCGEFSAYIEETIEVKDDE